MLPKDIQNYVKKKIISRIIVFLLLQIACIFLIVSGFNLLDNLGIVWKVFIVVSVIFIPFCVSGVPFKLIDRSWMGKILSVSVETVVDATSQFGYRPRLYRKNKIVLKIEREDKKICEERVGIYPTAEETHGLGYFSKSKTSGDINDDVVYYKPGAFVYHFYGLQNVVVFKENCNRVDCVICSTVNPILRDDCFCCGHSLIKPEIIKTKT